MVDFCRQKYRRDDWHLDLFVVAELTALFVRRDATAALWGGGTSVPELAIMHVHTNALVALSGAGIDRKSAIRCIRGDVLDFGASARATLSSSAPVEQTVVTILLQRDAVVGHA